MKKTTTNYDQACCFCDKKVAEHKELRFVQPDDGRDLFICEECFEKIVEALFSVNEQQTDIPDEYFQSCCEAVDCDELPGDSEDILPTGPVRPLATPEEIKAQLDQYIIGQEPAKQILAVAAYNHYKLLRYDQRHRHDDKAVEISKSNILLCGPSGVGKTATVKRLAQYLDVPVAICDCASLSKTGYVGRDPLSVMTELLFQADNDIARAERGIIYLDEFDKLAVRRDANNKDVTGEGVQQELLKLIEGCEIEINVGGPTPTQGGEQIRMNTKNILFICGGAFAGIEKLIADRKNSHARTGSTRPIGFGAASIAATADTHTGTMTDVTTEDLRAFGIIPEILGRLPVICTMQELKEKDLVAIMTQPKDAIIRQYEELLAMDNATLTLRKGALEAIAQEAIRCKTGARGLRTILEHILTPAMYAVPGMKEPVEITVTEECVTAGKAVGLRKAKKKDVA